MCVCVCVCVRVCACAFSCAVARFNVTNMAFEILRYPKLIHVVPPCRDQPRLQGSL